MASADAPGRGRRRAPSIAVVTLAASLLGACATGGAGPAVTGAASDTVARADDGRALVGDEGLRVVATYAAASGRTCRRLADADGHVLARVSCRQSGGEWTLGRTLGGRGPDGAAVAGEASATTTGTIGAGETLWAFAGRMTGDATNWRAIARLNGIDDARGVDAGRVLDVPGDMLLAARPDGRSHGRR